MHVEQWWAFHSSAVWLWPIFLPPVVLSLSKEKPGGSRHSLKCKLKQGVGQVKSAIHIFGEELPGVARLADEDFVCHSCYCLLSRVWGAKVGLDDLCSQFKAKARRDLLTTDPECEMSNSSCITSPVQTTYIDLNDCVL